MLYEVITRAGAQGASGPAEKAGDPEIRVEYHHGEKKRKGLAVDGRKRLGNIEGAREDQGYRPYEGEARPIYAKVRDFPRGHGDEAYDDQNIGEHDPEDSASGRLGKVVSRENQGEKSPFR